MFNTTHHLLMPPYQQELSGRVCSREHATIITRCAYAQGRVQRLSPSIYLLWSVRGQDCSCRFICHLCRNVSIAFAERCSHVILQLRTASQHRVHSCSIAYEHLSAKAILTFLHRWQMKLHEQSWPRTLHTTKEILFVKLSDGDDELVSQLRDG